jgi:hypothetical protein
MTFAHPASRALRRPVTIVTVLSLVLLSWSWLGSSPSTAASELYTVPPSGAWAIEGAGFGHGIGLSQWGAQGAALAGLRPDQILGFYYPGTSFGRIGNPDVRVQLSAYQGSSIVFGPYGGEQLTATDTANGARQALPAASRYRLTLDGTWMHLSVLAADGTWQPTALSGQVNIGGPIDVKGPSGFWAWRAFVSNHDGDSRGTTNFR